MSNRSRRTDAPVLNPQPVDEARFAQLLPLLRRAKTCDGCRALWRVHSFDHRCKFGFPIVEGRVFYKNTNEEVPTVSTPIPPGRCLKVRTYAEDHQVIDAEAMELSRAMYPAKARESQVSSPRQSLYLDKGGEKALEEVTPGERPPDKYLVVFQPENGPAEVRSFGRFTGAQKHFCQRVEDNEKAYLCEILDESIPETTPESTIESVIER